MKKVMSSVFSYLLLILLLPLLIIFCVCRVMYLPVDAIIYHRSQYYKDIKEKYRLYGADSNCFKLYNLIYGLGLPVEYVRNSYVNINAYGYFYFDDTLIVTDYIPSYDKEIQGWALVDSEDGGHDGYVSIEDGLQVDIDDFNKFMGREVCSKAILLVDADDLHSEELLHTDKCENLLVYNDENDLSQKLRVVINR